MLFDRQGEHDIQGLSQGHFNFTSSHDQTENYSLSS